MGLRQHDKNYKQRFHSARSTLSPSTPAFLDGALSRAPRRYSLSIVPRRNGGTEA